MIDIRLRRLTIFTLEGRRVVEFTAGLNVIVGPYGSGKTSLLELVKYALGGNARLSEAAELSVSSVVLEVALQNNVLAFERAIGSRTVNVTRGGDPEVVLHTTSSTAKGTVLASRFLLESCGLPVMRVRRSRRATSTAREAISFWDFYRFTYVSQSDMGQSIAGHADSQLDRKRSRAFELMFGLIDTKSAELETEEADLLKKIEIEEKRLTDVTAFLEATGVPGRAQALALLQGAESARTEGLGRLRSLRSNSRAQAHELAPEQQAIGGLHAQLTDLENTASSLRHEIDVRKRLASQITLEIEGLERAESVSRLVGPIDFTTCPRCLHAVTAERAPDTDCYLCLQPVINSNLGGALDVDRQNEIDRLQAVLAEVQELLADDEAALRVIEQQLVQARLDLRSREDRLRARTDSYVAPLFEEIADLSTAVAQSEAEIEQVNLALAQWNQRAAIQTAVDALSREVTRVRRTLAEEHARLEHRRALVVEFSETFNELIRKLELQWYTNASINVSTYLPVVGTGEFESLSGGQRTVVSVAYHLALLTTGLVNRRELRVPTLLILDTPSKYLGIRDASQVARNFRRVAAIVGAYDTPVQIVVADNDPPPSNVTPANTIELSYESPLIPGFEHPGPENVTSIHDPYDEE